MNQPSNRRVAASYKYTLTALSVCGAVTGLGAAGTVGRAVPGLTVFNSESATLLVLASAFFLAGRFLRTSSLVPGISQEGGRTHRNTLSAQTHPLSDAQPLR